MRLLPTWSKHRPARALLFLVLLPALLSSAVRLAQVDGTEEIFFPESSGASAIASP